MTPFGNNSFEFSYHRNANEYEKYLPISKLAVGWGGGGGRGGQARPNAAPNRTQERYAAGVMIKRKGDWFSRGRGPLHADVRVACKNSMPDQSEGHVTTLMALNPSAKNSSEFPSTVGHVLRTRAVGGLPLNDQTLQTTIESLRYTFRDESI